MFTNGLNEDFDLLETNFFFQRPYENISFHLEGNWEGFDESYHQDDTGSIEHMTLGEIRQYLDDYSERIYDSNDAEIAPLVAGLISAAPAIIQGVSGLVQSLSRPRQSAAPAPRPSQPATPPPPRAPAPSAVARTGPVALQPQALGVAIPASVPPAQGVRNDIATLLGLLQNSQILNAIQNLSGSTSPAGNTPVGNSNISVGAVLNTIAQLASNLGGAMSRESAYPEFYFDSLGNLLVDPASPENIGEFILEKLND